MSTRGLKQNKRARSTKTVQRTRSASVSNNTTSTRSLQTLSSVQSTSVMSSRARITTSVSSSKSTSVNAVASNITVRVASKRTFSNSPSKIEDIQVSPKLKANPTVVRVEIPVQSAVFQASKRVLVGDRPRQKPVGQLIDPKDPDNPYIISDFKYDPKTVHAPAVQHDPRDNLGLYQLGELGTPVTIYKLPKNAMQNEKNRDYPWLIRSVETAYAYTNQLNGADHVADDDYFPPFNTKDDAIAYCMRNHLEYRVVEEPPHIIQMRSYADNFKWKGPAPVDH